MLAKWIHKVFTQSRISSVLICNKVTAQHKVDSGFQKLGDVFLVKFLTLVHLHSEGHTGRVSGTVHK